MSSRLFDIVPLAFTSGPDAARTDFDLLVNRFSQFTGHSSHPVWGDVGRALFRSVDGPTASEILKGLDPIGVRTEIRPAAASSLPPQSSQAVEPAGIPCPSCSLENPQSQPVCGACGLVFAKYEKRAVMHMMVKSRLEQEVDRIRRIQQEANERASDYRAQRPLRSGATEPFKDDLLVEEVPFLRLETDSGPLLLTSKRVLAHTNGEVWPIPFEMIAGVDLGGGFSILGGSIRMVLTFKAPLLLGRSRVSSLSRQVKKNAHYDRETILHWVYTKNFICGGCGARDLDFRFENGGTRARCMRCAADHSIDLTHAVAKLIGET